MDQSRRRTSYLPSWAIDDDDDDCLTTTRASRRKSSWGPAGEQGLRDSIRSASSKSPVSHHECNSFYTLLTLSIDVRCSLFSLCPNFLISFKF